MSDTIQPPAPTEPFLPERPPTKRRGGRLYRGPLPWIVMAVGIMAILVPRVFAYYDERQQRLDGLNSRLQENLSGIGRPIRVVDGGAVVEEAFS